MEYIAVLNNYLEDSLDDRHTVNSSLSLLTEAGSKFFLFFHLCHHVCKTRTY